MISLKLCFMASSRTQKGIKNSIVALIYYIISVILGFISRKVFIDYLGADLLGLNTTAQNLMGFLNLAELGIGSAIAFTLYRPLAVGDRQVVKEIITVQGWLYRRIATFVLLGSVGLMAFFPLIFSNIELPLWYAFLSFGVYLYSSLLTYYTNYKQIILSANQEEYIITFNYKFVLLGQSVCQILAICYLPNPYIWWIAIQVVFSTLAAISLNIRIRKDYPYLTNNLKDGRDLSSKYPIIIQKVKQLFVHKIAGFVLTQASSLIIFAFTSLKVVAIYGNYMLIINNITMMFTSVFNGVTAGVGNLVAEGDKKRILLVFHELFSSRFFCVSIFIVSLYYLIDPFITLWVGEDFLLSKSTLLVILSIMYIMMTRTTVDAYISAYGLYQDIYAPIVEAILNLSFSILLGKYFGITGVLLGSFISLFCVVFCWKPYFMFTRGLKESLWQYVNMYLRHIISLSIAVLLISFLHKSFWFEPSNFLLWSADAVIVVVSFSVILYILMMLLTPGMRMFTKRLLKRL